MKKLSLIIGIIAGASLSYSSVAFAIGTPIQITGGGTGTTTAPSGQVIYAGGGTGLSQSYQSIATTSVTCSGSASCSSFTVLGSSPITITASGGGGTGTVGTSTNETKGTLSYWTTDSATPALLGKVATTTFTPNSDFSTTGTVGSFVGGANSTLALNMATTHAWTGLQSFLNASSTLFSNTKTAYFGGTATTTIDSAGNIVIPSGSNLTITGKSDGCATFASGVLNSTGSACGSGGGGTSAFEIATTSDIAISQLAYITKTSGRTTIGSTATSTLTATGLLSLSNAPSIIGASPAVLTLPLTKGNFIVGNDAGIAQATSTIFITSLGQVGIGTQTPIDVNANAKLTIAGISSQDIIASTTDNTTLSDAILQAYAPGSRVFLGAHGTNQVSTRYGITLGGWGEIGAFNSTSGTTNGLVIGTNPAVPIVFGTNNLERMRITSAGLVGIGTTTPLNILDISASDSGTLITSASAAMESIVNTNTTANNFSDLAFTTVDSTRNTISAAKISGVFTSHTNAAVSTDLSFVTDNAGTLRQKAIIKNNGDVGIGSSTPHAVLAVHANGTSPTKNIAEFAYATGGSADNATTTVATIASSTVPTFLVGTTTPFGAGTSNAITLSSGTTGTTTINLGESGNAGAKSCINMQSDTGAIFQLFIHGSSLQVVAGACTQ